MSLKKIGSPLEKCTRELAQQFVNMEPLPGERDLLKRRIKFFEKHIAGGTLYDLTWSKGICKADGKEYRLDGQHSSSALANHDPEKPFPNISVTIQVWEFDSLDEDAADLFNMFDNPASVRTDVDMIGVDRRPYAELVSLPKKFLDKAAKGMRYYNRLIENGRIFDKRRKGLYFHDPLNREFTTWLYQFVGTKHDWMIVKDGVVAEVYADYRYDKPLANEFWHLVFTESHPDPDHITRDLSATLRDWNRAARRKSIVQFHKLARKTWNAYRKMAEMSRQMELRERQEEEARMAAARDVTEESHQEQQEQRPQSEGPQLGL